MPQLIFLTGPKLLLFIRYLFFVQKKTFFVGVPTSMEQFVESRVLQPRNPGESLKTNEVILKRRNQDLEALADRARRRRQLKQVIVYSIYTIYVCRVRKRKGMELKSFNLRSLLSAHG